MGTPTTTAADLEHTLAAIRDTAGEAHRAVDSVISAGEAALTVLPGVFGNELREALARLRRMFDGAMRELAELIAQAGSPETLRAAGAVWAGDIGGTVSRLAGLATLNGTGADDYWTGVAADAYRNTLPAQQAALSTVKAVGDEVDTTLNALASAIIRFWFAVAVAMVGFVVAVASAIATASTGVGAPVGVTIAIAAVGATAVAVNEAVTDLTTITTDIRDQAAGLQRLLTNDTAFPFGRWPRSTTSISGDGSISDGDDTDWHLK
jgi:hypothetical protein